MTEYHNYRRFKAKCTKSTPKAILVDIEGMDEPLWIPQSQIDDRSEVWCEGDEGDLVISEWLAEQKGIS